MSNLDSGRRPLKTRSAAWAQRLATLLARRRVSPNAISVAGIGFALIGGALLLAVARALIPGWLGLLGAAACIQLRLLCNMLDGLVAVEGGVRSKAGALFNELPDRVEDTVLLAAAGHAAGAVELGWLAAALALLTAYLRAFGGSAGLPADFRGPGAKPQRMFWLSVGCLVACLYFPALEWALGLICVLVLVTAVRRAARIYRLLP
jgi:phosphatidylglycerophosphate synthase